MFRLPRRTTRFREANALRPPRRRLSQREGQMPRKSISGFAEAGAAMAQQLDDNDLLNLSHRPEPCTAPRSWLSCRCALKSPHVICSLGFFIWINYDKIDVTTIAAFGDRLETSAVVRTIRESVDMSSPKCDRAE